MRPMVIAVLLVLLAGCAPKTDSLGDMGCRTIDEYLPELDRVAAGGAASEDLYDRVKEEIRLGYFDDETEPLFQLLADPVLDQWDDSYTPVDIDYTDLRRRAIAYCEGSMSWEMGNA